MKANAKEIQEKLHKGVVEFTFRKKNGEIRGAIGTLAEEVLAKYPVKSEPNHTSSDKVQVFYDLEHKDFRCFSIGSEMEITAFHEC